MISFFDVTFLFSVPFLRSGMAFFLVGRVSRSSNCTIFCFIIHLFR